MGAPTLFTTTTPDTKIFADDLTRHLLAEIDTSPQQNRAIAKARARGPAEANRDDLAAWRMAMALLRCDNDDFKHPPVWLEWVAEHLPADVRVRRDWPRFLTFCKAIALCRKFRSKGPLDIEFRDYCVAYRILEPMLAATLQGLPDLPLRVAHAAAELNRRHKRGVGFKEIAHELNWKPKVAYRHAQEALRLKLIRREPETRERNEKRIWACDSHTGRFLTEPSTVLRRNPSIGRKVRYVDPFTGKTRTVKR
jgi:hypothetical protein